MTKVIYSKEIPDIYYVCNKQFGVEWDNEVIFTYGDTVYCKVDLSDDMKAHEETHVRQQAIMGAKAWWDRYLVDPAFRLEQELEAYKNQLIYAKAVIKDRNRLFRYRHQVLMDISSSMYGNMITYTQAMNLL